MPTNLYFWVVLLVLWCPLSLGFDFWWSSDADKNVTELISSNGYIVEDHEVVTKDGYIISVQRIPCGRNETRSKTRRKEAVVLTPGIFFTAAAFFLNSPNQSLGFILPDSGYDAWFINSRGCQNSKRHIKYSPSKSKFWDFSWQEMAEFDLPAVIDYVLNITGHEKLSYIGHSMGTTEILALLSEYPEYNDKIKINIALSPLAFCKEMYFLQQFFFASMSILARIIWPTGILEGESFSDSYKIICSSPLKFICEETISLSGRSTELNTTRLDVYAAHFPAGTSLRTAAHFGQLVRNGRFCKYDFGKSENLKRYNQKSPPDYNLSNIRAPIALMWASNDYLVSQEDVDTLRKQLLSAPIVFDQMISDESFVHLDFIWGMKATDLVYNKVVDILKKYDETIFEEMWSFW